MKKKIYDWVEKWSIFLIKHLIITKVANYKQIHIEYLVGLKFVKSNRQFRLKSSRQ